MDLFTLKSFLLANIKYWIREMGPHLRNVKRATTTVLLSEYDFNLYKGFLVEKNALNLPDFEGIFVSNRQTLMSKLQ